MFIKILIAYLCLYQIRSMFSFFQKKIFLIDHLYGLVDMHNHILPGIDDGAKTVEDSINLIKGFSEFGVTNFVCTPHIMHNYYPNTPKTIHSSYEKLKKEIQNLGLEAVSITAAAEHMIDDNFESILESDSIMPLGKYHMLVEMSFLQPPINFNESIEKIQSKGFFPILAHPERYAFLHSDYSKYKIHKDSGILFQINLLSLGNYYGSEMKKIALKLLNNDLVDFVGTDVHRMDQLMFLKEIKISNNTAKKLNPIINKTIDTFF